jgi:hypothetical protein
MLFSLAEAGGAARLAAPSSSYTETSASTMDDVCLLQFLKRGQPAAFSQQSARILGYVKTTAPQAEPCCGDNPTSSSAGGGECRERGVDLFARHEGLVELFGDNVAMNPSSYKFFLEGSCDYSRGKLRCEYTEITDPDVYSHPFPVGKSNVKISALDISGNKYECTKTLYVHDEEPPVFTTPPEERAPVLTYSVDDTTCNIANGEPFDAYEGLGFSATATDNCDKAVEIVRMIYDKNGTKLYDSREHDASGSFTDGPGEYKLVYVAIDDYSSTIKFPDSRDTADLQTMHNVSLILKDSGAPTQISECPADINVTIEPHETETKAGNVTWTVPEVTKDNCLHKIPAIEAEEVSGTAPGAKFPVGATRVKYVFHDGSGNAYAEECKFTVTVVQRENPVELACPANISADTLEHASFALVTWPAPVATQGGTPLEVTYPQGVASGMPFPFGTTDVKVKAVGTLPVGQTGDPPFAECFFSVTVRDTEDPMCDGRKLQCATGSPAGQINTYDICGGPQLDVTRHGDFATLEYEIDGVLSPEYGGCCGSELGATHACVAAAPDSPTMYCKDQEGPLLQSGGPPMTSGPALQSEPPVTSGPALQSGPPMTAGPVQEAGTAAPEAASTRIHTVIENEADLEAWVAAIGGDKNMGEAQGFPYYLSLSGEPNGQDPLTTLGKFLAWKAPWCSPPASMDDVQLTTVGDKRGHVLFYKFQESAKAGKQHKIRSEENRYVEGTEYVDIPDASCKRPLLEQ